MKTSGNQQILDNFVLFLVFGLFHFVLCLSGNRNSPKDVGTTTNRQGVFGCLLLASQAMNRGISHHGCLQKEVCPIGLFFVSGELLPWSKQYTTQP